MRKSLFSLAAITFLAAMMTACGSDNILTEVEENINENNGDNETELTEGIHFTAVIDAKPSSTRALTDVGDGTLTKTWQVNEKVSIVIANNTSIRAYQANVDEVKDGAAYISATIAENTPNNQAVTLIYPNTAYFAYTEDFVNSALLLAQDGTFATLSSKYDVATGLGNLDVDGTSATMMAKVTMENKYAIFKFTFQNSGSNLTGITNLNITDYVNGDAIAAVTNDSGLEEVYVAMPASKANQRMQFEVVTNAGYYTGKANANLTASNYYQPTLTLTAVDTSSIPNWDLSDVVDTTFVGKVIAVSGTSNKVFNTALKAKIAGYTPVAMIAYVPEEDIEGNRLAISLTTVTPRPTWNTLESNSFVPTYGVPCAYGYSWLVLSKEEYTNCGWNGLTNIATLKSRLANCGGSALGDASTAIHWTSTEYNSTSAWAFNTGNGGWQVNVKTANRHVRPGFAF